MELRLRVQNPEGRTSPVFESVSAQRTGPNTYIVACTPVLVEEIARGDRITVFEDGRFRVDERGGNVGVQLFRGVPTDPATEQDLLSQVELVGGQLDTSGPTVLVFSIPLKTSGFGMIEALFTEVCSKYPGSGWMYGNVYTADDAELPLGWWIETP